MFLLVSGLLNLYYILFLFKSEQYSHNNDGSNHNKDAHGDVGKPDADGISHLAKEVEEKLIPVGSLNKAGEELAVKDGMYRFSMDTVKDFTLVLEGESGEVLRISYGSDQGNLSLFHDISGRFEGIGRDAKDLEILYDRGILEISANHHMLYKVTDFTELRNRPVHKVTLTAGEVNVKVEVC